MTERQGCEFDGKAYATQLSTAPGVYRMYAADGTLLYVGKASALRKRVASYFNASPKNARLTAMLNQVARMEVTVTRHEAEALLLENQLIKSLSPKYNVLLRDDKSYAQILLTKETWSRICVHRGPRAIAGRYFGPYPNSSAVRETLNLMQKLFKLRTCEDSIFKNRTRPCLQYQIGRCSAPCVGRVTSEDYAQSLHRATLVLNGKNDQLAQELMDAMQTASENLDFESAAHLRDLLSGLRTLQNRQYVDGQAADLDVLACATRATHACIVLQSFRDGRNLGTRAYFPKTNGEHESGAILAAFVSQHYVAFTPPSEILLNQAISDHALLEAALSQAAQRKVTVRWNVRGERAGYVDLAVRNALVHLTNAVNDQSAQQLRSHDLQTLLGLTEPLKRVECFDISHTLGEATQASCVVFDGAGPVRAQYRRYNISGITPGDDYAAMRQALERRFRRAAENRGTLPDVLLIDGGQGQLAQAVRVLADAELAGITVVGVAKGKERRAGDETLVMADGRVFRPGAASPALQFVQQVRDEAHRFAITGHRGRRQKARLTSQLEEIPGVGSRRRGNLLRHFGGLAGLKAAGEQEIARVNGINRALAARIYAHLHGLPPPEPVGQ